MSLNPSMWPGTSLTAGCRLHTAIIGKSCGTCELGFWVRHKWALCLVRVHRGMNSIAATRSNLYCYTNWTNSWSQLIQSVSLSTRRSALKQSTLFHPCSTQKELPNSAVISSVATLPAVSYKPLSFQIGGFPRQAAGVSASRGSSASGGISTSAGAYRRAPSSTRVASILGIIGGDEDSQGGAVRLDELKSVQTC